MRTVSLTTATAGITRQRDKGGARPDTLFDLLNAYVTAAGNIRPRPGTVTEHTLPEGTKGLTAFRDKLHVFAITPTDPGDARFQTNVLVHPENPETPLQEIHFAEPFLGFLYVVAEFAGGDVFHYWLQSLGPWEPNKVYAFGSVVEPTTPNGLGYSAAPANPAAPVWQPNIPRQVGDRVSPTVPNGFEYEVIEVIGDDPKSGATEPNWPTVEDATIFEDVNIPTPSSPSTGGSGSQPPPSTIDRYGGGGGIGGDFDLRQL